MNGIYIAAAKRSAIGKLGGSLASLTAAEIGAQVIEAILRETDLDPATLDEVIIGQVLQGGMGQNPARQTALKAGIPVNVPAMTVNKVCGAGQKSIHLAAQAIMVGDASLILAGGQDSMSRAPLILPKDHVEQGMSEGCAKEMMILDGLWCAIEDIHMGNTVEALVRRFAISREEQDAFAFSSQLKVAAAQAAGRFDREICPITFATRNGNITFEKDEHPRSTSVDKLAALSPVFDPSGTITVGNASGVNDGASAVLVGDEKRIATLGLTPLVRIASYASFAMDPIDMGLGPVGASKKALDKAGWSVNDLDIVEVNEAFAAQSLAVQRELGLDPDKLNPNGGAIALGHPLAGSGNRILVTLIHEMLRRKVRRGLATLCIGGGMGIATCLELA